MQMRSWDKEPQGGEHEKLVVTRALFHMMFQVLIIKQNGKVAIHVHGRHTCPLGGQGYQDKYFCSPSWLLDRHIKILHAAQLRGRNGVRV